jgi:hypothetical protein
MNPQPVAHELLPSWLFHRLASWAELGVPASCGETWSEEAVMAAIQKGPSKSARTAAAIALIHTDLQEQVDAGFLSYQPVHEILARRPANLKISPLAVIPQHDRRDRIIIDLSAQVEQRTHDAPARLLAHSVNESSTPATEQRPILAIGTVMRSFLFFLFDAPADHVVLFSKIDLSDGFWRMHVDVNDRFNFAFVVPGTTPLALAIPEVLQMGWTNSPAYFTVGTEAGCIIIYRLLQTLTSSRASVGRQIFPSGHAIESRNSYRQPTTNGRAQ